MIRLLDEFQELQRAPGRAVMRLRMTTAPAKKHVNSMSVMPADGILAARRPDKDFGTSRFKGN
jgi:hypothetical protein